MNEEIKEKAPSAATAVLVFMILVAVITNLSLTLSIKNMINDRKAVAAAASAEEPVQTEDSGTATAEKRFYILVLDDGIAVLRDKNGDVVESFEEINTAYLTDTDAEALKAGIRIESEAELASVLGDLMN